MMLRWLMALSMLLAPLPAVAERPDDGQRLILVTMDGTRWQDVFRGPDKAMVADPKITHPDWKETVERAWGASGAALMPFLNGLPAQGGVLFGNRDAGECMAVANPMWFSYPGYNEMLTGRADPAITSNDKTWNRNVTFLEWINNRKGFMGTIGVFAMWDAFPFILNEKRSGLAVNGAAGAYPNETRTMRLAEEALRSARGMRVLYVALGNTDWFAHEGDYAQYLAAMNRDDDFIAELWRIAQADPAWRGRTTLIVTTDHGRGTGAAWTEHGSAAAYKLAPHDYLIQDPAGFPGSEQIWFAAIGPGVHAVPAARLKSAACFTQGQIAASALTALGEDWKAFDPGAAPPLPFFR